MDTSAGKILIVDDNINNVKILRSILGFNFYTVKEALSGKNALQILEQETFDLILLDIMMPEMDGYEVCRRIKKDERLQQIPIVFLTAKTETEDLIEGFHAGGIDYITKPFNHEELLIRIKTHIELKKSKELTQKQAIELKAINASKDKLFSLIAHDLRNTMGSYREVLEFLSIDMMNMDADSFQEIIAALKLSAEQTYNLLENLLHWARIQRKDIKLRPEIIQLPQLIEECLNILKQSTWAKSIRISTNSNKNLTVFADPEHVRMILKNLISNAIKYSKRNSEIKIKAIQNGNKVEISVSDSGIGIPSEDLNKVLDKNNLFSTYGTDGEKGSGLGFAICVELIELNNGTLQVISEVEKGTAIICKLPSKSD
jgi:two-component system sensor histidine kinase/response regulator